MKKIFSLMLLLATLFTFTACGGDDDPDAPRLTKTDYTLFPEENQRIQGDNLDGVYWDSENEFVATVKNNMLTGQYVGETVVKSADEDLVLYVEVEPYTTTYEEPYLNWGASKSTIKSKCGTPTTEDTDMLVYQTSNAKAPLVMYSFENGKLDGAAVFCDASAASELADFLTERYVLYDVDSDSGTATLLHCYGKLNDPQVDYVVGMIVESSLGGVLIMYMPVSTYSNRSVDSIDFEAFAKKFENAY